MAQTLILIFAVLSLSQAGNLIRLCDTSAITITFYRLLLALLIMLPFAAKKLRRLLPTVGPKVLFTIFLMSLAFSSHFFAWITAIQKTKVANAAICFSFSPIFTALGAYLFLKEAINVRLFLAITGGVLGIFFVSQGDLSLSPGYFEGDLYALLSGFLFSIHCLLGRTLRKNIPNLFIMSLLYFFGVLTSLAVIFFLDAPLWGFNLKTQIGFVSLAVFPTILGHASLIYLMKYFTAATVSTAILLEPVLAGIVAYFAFAETLTVWSTVGYAFIVAGLIPLYYFQQSRIKDKVLTRKIPLAQ